MCQAIHRLVIYFTLYFGLSRNVSHEMVKNSKVCCVISVCSRFVIILRVYNF